LGTLEKTMKNKTIPFAKKKKTIAMEFLKKLERRRP
jgi:hypothetical protein